MLNLPLNCWENQIRTRTEIKSTRTLRATTVKNIIVARKTFSRASTELAIDTYSYRVLERSQHRTRSWESRRLAPGPDC